MARIPGKLLFLETDIKSGLQYFLSLPVKMKNPIRHSGFFLIKSVYGVFPGLFGR